MSYFGNHSPAKENESVLCASLTPREDTAEKHPREIFGVHIHPSERRTCDGRRSFPASGLFYRATVFVPETLRCGRPRSWFRLAASSTITRTDFAFIVSQLEEQTGAQRGPAPPRSDPPWLAAGVEQQKPHGAVGPAEGSSAFGTYRVAAQIYGVAAGTLQLWIAMRDASTRRYVIYEWAELHRVRCSARSGTLLHRVALGTACLCRAGATAFQACSCM